MSRSSIAAISPHARCWPLSVMSRVRRGNQSPSARNIANIASSAIATPAAKASAKTNMPTRIAGGGGIATVKCTQASHSSSNILRTTGRIAYRSRPMSRTKPAGRREELALLLERRADELADEVMARVRDRLPPWMREPDAFSASRAFTRHSVAAELEAWRAGGALPESCPDVDAQGARLGARAGAPLDVLLRGYRTGHAVQWEAWFELVERHQLDPDERRALLSEASSFLFDYADRLASFVTIEYSDERERVLRSREQRRVHLVRDLLDGSPAPADEVDYEIEARHVGLVAWGADAAEVARELARVSDRALLLVSAVDGTWWAWLGGNRALDGRGRAALERMRPPPGTQVAIGLEEPGREGFRRTHRQALAAERVGKRTGAALTAFESIALETLAAADEPEAHAFVARELDPLGSDARAQRLRETLRAYFSAGHNAAATAAALGVHEQTVANRLRAVEALIGRPVAARSAELETALRLRAYLDPSSDATSSAKPG